MLQCQKCNAYRLPSYQQCGGALNHVCAGGVETGSNTSGYLASQGIVTEGGSGRAPEGTPEVIALEDMPAADEGPSTAVAPTDTTAKAPATPVQVEETAPRAEPEGEIAPLPVSTPGGLICLNATSLH